MSDAPTEEEVPVYRGKTLTPESPRPLHVPSPANIPILEHQIDPIFNLMSTHIEQPQAQTQIAQDIPKETGQQAMVDMNVSEPGASEPAQPTDPTSENVQNFDISTKPSEDDVAAAGQNSESYPPATPAAAADFADVNNAIPENDSFNEGQTASVDMNQLPTFETQGLTAHNIARDQAASSAQDPTSASTQGQPEIVTSQALDTVANPDIQALMKSLQVPLPALSTENTASSAVPADSQTSPSGLPPRPPPQEKPSIHPNYEPGADIRSFHFPNPTSSPRVPTTSPTAAPLPGSNGQTIDVSMSDQALLEGAPSSLVGPAPDNSSEKPPEDLEQAWRTFQDEESVFTAEGAWEKFPHGSRLFVGNLPTESVSRREIFNIFHKYGKLAQISIKQAYGFVQFMDVESCQRAMKAEQGARIKERNMHLEISKPPKNSRGGNKNDGNANSSSNNNNNQSSAGDRIRDRHRRDRSRSPGRRNRGSRGGNSTDMRYSDFRDEPRRGRDDYRPGRSPSPRRGDGYRPRDRSADRHYDGRRRSRSPFGRTGYGRRSPSPRRTGLSDDDLPLPHRAPRDVPDVQIILVDEVSRPFVEYVVGGFQAKGIRCDVLNLPRVPIEAVIRRQIVEGVVAVCNLGRQEERTGKVPLQVFDRSRGAHDVRFDEYENLEMPIAAELALRAKSNNIPPPTPTFGGNSGSAGPYVPPYLQQVASAAQQAPNANLQNLVTSLDPATLQQLMGVVGQTQPSSATTTTPTQPTFPGQMGGHQDLGALLSVLTPQQQQDVQAMQDRQARSQAQLLQQQQREQQVRLQTGAGSGYPYATAGQQQQQQQQHTGYTYGQPQQPQPQYAQQPQHPSQTPTNNVQSIMEQLASIQRQG